MDLVRRSLMVSLSEMSAAATENSPMSAGVSSRETKIY
jgi:hypothetical protein